MIKPLLDLLRAIPAPGRLGLLLLGLVSAIAVAVLRFFGIQSDQIDGTLAALLVYLTAQSAANVSSVPETDYEYDEHVGGDISLTLTHDAYYSEDYDLPEHAPDSDS